MRFCQSGVILVSYFYEFDIKVVSFWCHNCCRAYYFGVKVVSHLQECCYRGVLVWCQNGAILIDL